jgi:hypothetical protein
MGTRVGVRARKEFPGAVLIESDARHHPDAVAATQELFKSGAPAILEASFFQDDVFVAVDVLSREEDACACHSGGYC